MRQRTLNIGYNKESSVSFKHDTDPFNLWFIVYGFWFLVCGLCFLTTDYGLRTTDHGLLVYGLYFQVSNVRRTILYIKHTIFLMSLKVLSFFVYYTNMLTEITLFYNGRLNE